MSKIIKIISTKISSGKRLIKYLGLGRSDVQEKNQATPYGVDSNPIKDMVALVIPTSEIGQDLVVGYINKNQISDTGEIRLFSTDTEGSVKIAIHLKNDGVAEIGGNSDFMVRFSKLEEGFNELRDDHNSHVSSYNGHIHITTATIQATPVIGVLSPTVSTSTPSTADIAEAKIDNLKCS